jgi:ornithine cyclodeaminase/alanine dehydrogenase-like protein (mu-crystallin family)
MTPLYLTEDDVRAVVDVRTAVDLVEEAFRRLAAGEARNVPRARVRASGIVLHTMSAAAEYLDLAGWKCYATARDGATFHVGLYDRATGQLAALIEADYLGQVRTGATTAVAAEWMAPAEASEVGLLGSGRQARAQLAAVAVVRPIKRAFVYSRDEARRQAFAEAMSAQLGIEVLPVDRPQVACTDLPIVVTATTSAAPVFSGMDLAEGALVCAIGSNWPGRAEIDADVLRRADNIVCDSVEACRLEAGDFADALEKGIFDWSRAVDLADVVAGRAVGRNTRESICLFKSVGLAIEDLAVGAWVLSRARERGLGRPLGG